jgi:3-methylcrotonyl-CoA carboxylase alpha subunit
MTYKSIHKLLIANRGEIACRIIRTAHKMGIECVAIYSEADQNSQHVKLADEAWYIGQAPAKDSYLKVDTIIKTTKDSGANAIHPGYGFLSEKAEFAHHCAKENIIFVGPPVKAIEAMGSKSNAKTIMLDAGVPLVEGYHGDDQSVEKLHKEADRIGYPLLIKATAGGGGKGMRVVRDSSKFEASLESCKREAISSFGDDIVLVEKYLTKPRHVEIQIFVDNHGNAVHLFERDCSLQRRHQKIIEEAPAPGLSVETRETMGQVAITAAKAIGYSGAGTVEFLYDEDGSFYFMEMNTRLQVEHPVTEMITGLDLVEWQIVVANDKPLPLYQDQLSINGHAFEARIYAEDPDNNFLPVTGKINYMDLPQLSKNIRVDSGIVSGDTVSVYYDPMIAKLVVWDKDRNAALARLRGALTDFQVAGLTTNIEFLHQLASNDSFVNANLDTHFLEKHGQELTTSDDSLGKDILAAASLYQILKQSDLDCGDNADPFSPWNIKTGWRLNEDNYHAIELIYQAQHHLVVAHFRERGFLFEIDGDEFLVNGSINKNKLQIDLDGHKYIVSIAEVENRLVIFKNAKCWNIDIKDSSLVNLDQDSQANLTAPMPGTVIEVLVSSGDIVKKEQTLIVLEAMKMEHTIKAHQDTVIKEVLFSVGDLVDEGVELIVFAKEK